MTNIVQQNKMVNEAIREYYCTNVQFALVNWSDKYDNS